MTNKSLSVESAAQRFRLAAALKSLTSISTSQARDELAIMSPAPRIMELRRRGWDIRTDRVWIADSLGVPHLQAQYVLVSEPDPEEVPA